MPGTMTWAGLDVHARSIQAAVVLSQTGELRRMGFGGEPEAVVAWLSSLPAPVHACYEAGPTGYGLARAAAAVGLRMDVIAPSKTPRAAGDRIKTDRKDAELLVRLLMAGQLHAVAVPPAGVEAARDLTRAREAVRVDLARWRHRVSKLLLRYGRVWPKDKGTWTHQHRLWLEGQRFDHPASDLAYLDALAAMDGLLHRRAQLDERLAVLARDPQWWPTVARLRGFRGIDTLSALALHLEIHDWHRFGRPAQLAAWVGLVPARTQTGESDHHGAITKTGSAHARRLLVEAAWHYQRRPLVGITLQRRQDGLPDHVLAISARCQRRVYRTHTELRGRGKPANVATVAAARELACFLWAAVTAP
jgi:transposase